MVSGREGFLTGAAKLRYRRITGQIEDADAAGLSEEAEVGGQGAPSSTWSTAGGRSSRPPAGVGVRYVSRSPLVWRRRLPHARISG